MLYSSGSSIVRSCSMAAAAAAAVGPTSIKSISRCCWGRRHVALTRLCSCALTMTSRDGFSYRRDIHIAPSVSNMIVEETYEQQDTAAIATNAITSAQSLVSKSLSRVNENIRKSLQRRCSGRSPMLADSSRHYFAQEGKYFRPLIALLMANAFSHYPCRHPPSVSLELVSNRQQKLAEVSEMIHTASLLHDDVIDKALTRRNRPSTNALFGDKQSVLAGDFVMATASAELARLGSTRVVEVMAGIMEDLVHGELLQLEASADPKERWDHYSQKTFMKTASLIARSCQAVTLLGGHNEDSATWAFEYGRHVGIAFQIVDDVLDFVATAEEMGKPTAADLSLGLSTAPVLFASEEFPALIPMMLRRFKREGDIHAAMSLVMRSRGIERSRALAKDYCDRAVVALDPLPDSPAKRALTNLTLSVLLRHK